MTGPVFDHDCEACVYLGTEGPASHNERVMRCNAVDLYHCPRDTMDSGGTYIRRYSSEGSQYSSMAVSIVMADLEYWCHYVGNVVAHDKLRFLMH